MVKIFHKTIKDNNLNLLDDFRIGSWIYAENPREQEIGDLAERFKLEPGLLRDAIDPYEVPRLEIEDSIVYVFTRLPFKEEKIFTQPLLVAIGNDFISTVTSKQIPFLQKFIDGGVKNFCTTQKTKFFLQIFSEINFVYNNYFYSISRQVRETGVKIDKIENEDIIKLISFENILNDFLAALLPTNVILNNLLGPTLTGKFLELYENDKDLIEDLILSNGQLIDLCQANLKNIVNIREAYSTIVANNLNRTMKFLTSITVILTVPMIVGSLWGMNIPLPLANSSRAFLIMTLGILAVSIILLIIFTRRKWL